MESLRKYVAELIGTFVLVFFGCGTACVVGCDAAIGSGYILTALAFGLVIVAMAYSIGNVSGSHINPAVSLAMLINGKLTLKDFLFYVCSQTVGAVLGALLLGAFVGVDSGLGANAIYNNNVALSIAIEVILTFVFVIAILGVTSKTENSSVAGLVIGLTLVLVHILGIGFTGTSVNPARSIGPALIAGGKAATELWIFIVAPLLGSAVAALLYRFLDPVKKTEEKKDAAKK